MITKSDFKDYYDVAQSLGQDRSQVYMRYKKAVELGKRQLVYEYGSVQEKHCFPTFGSVYPCKHYNEPLHVEQSTIGFCGKVYGVLNIEIDSRAQRYCYSVEDVDKLVKDHFKRRDVENYHKKDYNRNNSWGETQRHDRFARYFESVDKIKDKFKDMFFDAHSPIFVAKPKYEDGRFFTEVTFNDCLKDYEFYRVFNPYAAFQEISMFFGNMAEPRKPIPQLSNNDKIEAAGHDLKMSFRKPKAKP